MDGTLADYVFELVTDPQRTLEQQFEYYTGVVFVSGVDTYSNIHNLWAMVIEEPPPESPYVNGAHAIGTVLEHNAGALAGFTRVFVRFGVSKARLDDPVEDRKLPASVLAVTQPLVPQYVIADIKLDEVEYYELELDGTMRPLDNRDLVNEYFHLPHIDEIFVSLLRRTS